MPENNPEEHLKLPVNVVSKTDVGRLVREVEELDEFLKQANIREPGTQAKLPKTSRMLDEFLSSNQLNALHEDDRHRLYMFLQTIKEQAPVLHMSFAADPSPRFQQQLMTWLRLNIDSMVLVQIGLQPNIGAGLVMRTTNKYFDLSLREFFMTKRNLLVEKIHGTDEEATKEKEEIIKSQSLLEQDVPAGNEAANQQPVQPSEPTAPVVPEHPDASSEVPASVDVPSVIQTAGPAAPQPATAPETPAATAPVPTPAAPPTPAPAIENPPSAPPPPPLPPQAEAPQPALPPQNYQPPKPLVGEHSGSPK